MVIGRKGTRVEIEYETELEPRGKIKAVYIIWTTVLLLLLHGKDRQLIIGAGINL